MTTPLLEQSAADLKFLMAAYLTPKDVRYRRLLEGLSDSQLRHACGAFCQGMMFGSERNGEQHTDESGGFAATCTRIAILAGYAEGCGYQKDKP